VIGELHQFLRWIGAACQPLPEQALHTTILTIFPIDQKPLPPEPLCVTCVFLEAISGPRGWVGDTLTPPVSTASLAEALRRSPPQARRRPSEHRVRAAESERANGEQIYVGRAAIFILPDTTADRGYSSRGQTPARQRGKNERKNERMM